MADGGSSDGRRRAPSPLRALRRLRPSLLAEDRLESSPSGEAFGGLQRVDVSELWQLVSEVGERCGLPAEHAPLFADAVLQADLRGIPSHGVFRLGIYARGFLTGEINPVPRLREFGSRSGSRVIDGDNGLGLIVGQLAMDRAVALAQANGVGAISVRNSNHSGVLAVHVQRAAAAGLIGFFTSNAPALMAPWGGREALISNSPFAYAFPSGGEPVIVDMACSSAARGRIRLAAAAGRTIPSGWALDSDGNATEDALAAMDGLVLPMAEHKGSAVAVAFEILSVCLSGARLSKDVPREFLGAGADTLDSWEIGHFALAIDIEAMRPLRGFEEQIDELADAVRSSPPRAGFEQVQMPGDKELGSVRHLRSVGVPLSEQTLAELERLRKELMLESPLTPFPAETENG